MIEEIIFNKYFSLGASAFLFIWLLILTVLLLRAMRHYGRLTQGITKKNLKRVLNDILEEIRKQNEASDQIKKRCKKLEREKKRHLQKVGFVRFNPFSDTGGDQSFCLVILDENGDGIMLSSLHTRGTTRIYAKEVQKGKGKNLSLSDEEKEAIKKAKRGGF
jgi:hypothetical protein